MKAEMLYVGCYTHDGGGSGEGIELLSRNPNTGSLTRLGVAAHTPSPSFLARHPRLAVLYAVNQSTEGAISAFSVVADGALSLLAVRPTAGAHPCHLAVSADGRHLLVANYASGSVTVFPLDSHGVPGERCDQVTFDGRGPDAERQERPHAHMVAPDPHTADILVTDLGTDQVHRLRLDPVAGRLSSGEPAVVTPPGTGPRHLARSGDGALLLVGELAATLSWYRPDLPEGRLRAEGTIATTGASQPSLPSEVVVSPDNRFVYVANRGPDTVAVFSWDGRSANRVAEVPTGGRWPRHIALLGEHLYVANERSHVVTTFRIDPDSGTPQESALPTPAHSPSCLLRWAAAD